MRKDLDVCARQAFFLYKLRIHYYDSKSNSLEMVFQTFIYSCRDLAYIVAFLENRKSGTYSTPLQKRTVTLPHEENRGDRNREIQPPQKRL
ncbi:hypothetical protein EI42_03070 [Thermosporothrix hazakensis]|uniref:Uncharacterized protein n=1 Tax=Thermosporothrix hazakensis TaxID=644383 RepID=A0A326U7B1_THEHA|nr:hypothetical protein EI42_03070 [Thermosporothrix hazakensis]